MAVEFDAAPGRVALGLNWEQNSTAALMIDGKIVGCVSEERFSRVKNDERYPKQAIEFLLDSQGLKKSDVDAVCYISTAWAPSYALTRHYSTYSVQDLVHEQYRVWRPRIMDGTRVSQVVAMAEKLDLDQYPGRQYWQQVVDRIGSGNDHASNSEMEAYGQSIRREVVCQHLGSDPADVHFIDHHEGHAAYAYFASPHVGKSALVVTLDAFGDHRNYTAFSYETSSDDSMVAKLIVEGNNFIIGRLYRYVTLILGMKSNEHEYKVMGMAPYGDYKYAEPVLDLFRSYQSVDNLEFRNVEHPPDLYFSVRDQLEGFRFDAVSAGLQLYTEQLVSTWMSNVLEETKHDVVCLAGGVGMNVKANGIMAADPRVREFYVPPSPDDSSQAMGALYAWANGLGSRKSSQEMTVRTAALSDAYLGPEISSRAAREALEGIRDDPRFAVSSDVVSVAAEVLASGGIVARAVGRAEFGARALGNRSILAHPANLDSKIRINDQVKSRDFWMPFAASVLQEKAHDYLVLDASVEAYSYMTNTCHATELGKVALKAALHPHDHTCRPHIVGTGVNPEYEEIIKAFGDKTGIYAVLNTSLNFHGSPIVNTAHEALDLFLQTELSALIVGDSIIVRKSEASEFLL